MNLTREQQKSYDYIMNTPRMCMSYDECIEMFEKRLNNYSKQVNGYKELISVILWFEYATLEYSFSKRLILSTNHYKIAIMQLNQLFDKYKDNDDDSDDIYTFYDHRKSTLRIMDDLFKQYRRNNKYFCSYSNEIEADEVSDRIIELLNIDRTLEFENNETTNELTGILQFIGRT